MTRAQLDNSFVLLKAKMLSFTKGKGILAEDAEDLVHAVYIRAASGEEYTKVSTSHIKTWFFYKLRNQIARFKDSRRTEHVLQAAYEVDPTIVKDNDELSERESYEVLKEYWEGLTRFERSKIRQQWKDEQRPLFDFMEPVTADKRRWN